jgi:3',5'-nucleoside bisphosphate phosphatase
VTSAGAPDGTAIEPGGHVDLHMHSTASDGLLRPSEVVAAAVELRLQAIALTDHDTISGVAEASEAGRAAGVEVIAGVELSAVEKDVETHVLGLHLTRLDWIGARLEEMRQMRLARAEQIVTRLNRLGVQITLEEVFAQSGGGAVGRPHVARALVARGDVADFREAFDRLLGNGRPAFVQKDRLAFAEAVSIIHESGGLAFLAHPGRGATRERFQRWRAAGADGVEVLHPSHSDEEIGRIARLTEELGLIPTGGSDWHGQPDGYRRLGMMNVPRVWLARQKSAAARLREQRVA